MFLLLIFMLLLLISFIPFYMELEFKESKLIFKLYILKILKIKLNLNVKSDKVEKMSEILKEKSESDFNTDETYQKYSYILEMLLSYFDVYKSVMYYILNKIKVKKIIWTTKIGLKDAALTGISVGFLWSIKSMITSFISKITSIENLKVNISPLYNLSKIDIYFNCIIKFKVVYIIIAGIKFLKLRKKGREINVRTSD